MIREILNDYEDFFYYLFLDLFLIAVYLAA